MTEHKEIFFDFSHNDGRNAIRVNNFYLNLKGEHYKFSGVAYNKACNKQGDNYCYVFFLVFVLFEK